MNNTKVQGVIPIRNGNLIQMKAHSRSKTSKSYPSVLLKSIWTRQSPAVLSVVSRSSMVHTAEINM